MKAFGRSANCPIRGEARRAASLDWISLPQFVLSTSHLSPPIAHPASLLPTLFRIPQASISLHTVLFSDYILAPSSCSVLLCCPLLALPSRKDVCRDAAEPGTATSIIICERANPPRSSWPSWHSGLGIPPGTASLSYLNSLLLRESL